MTQSNPLVTFLLVTYNQEAFVGNALCGALAQTYEPLEILIADDCSTDGTLMVVEKKMAGYAGPHRVRIVPATNNLGLFGNIQRGVAASQGALIVIGAGDDIPLAHRVTAMTRAWQRTGATGLHSHYEEMADTGTPLGREGVARAPNHVLWGYMADKHDRAFVGGATSAYDRTFLQTFPATSERIFHEDSMLTLAIHAMGATIVEVPQVTVQYRVHAASYSNRHHNLGVADGIVAQERDLSRYARDGHAYLNYLRHCWLPSISSSDPSIVRRLDCVAIDAALRRMQRQAEWIHASPAQRLSILLASRSWADLRFAVPRVFGLSAFAHMRVLMQRAIRRFAGRPASAS